jgi:hypothetical protein
VKQAGLVALSAFVGAGGRVKQMITGIPGMVSEKYHKFGDEFRDAYYEFSGTKYSDRSYNSNYFQQIQSRVGNGESAGWARFHVAKNDFLATSTLGLEPLFENVFGNMMDYSEGKIDIWEYNINQGGDLGEAGAMYVMARTGRGSGAANQAVAVESRMSLKTGLQNIKTGAVQTTKNAIKSVRESVGKFFEKINSNERGSLTLKGTKYQTTPLLKDFVGEETGKVFGSKVKYLSKAERSIYELFVKDGKLFDSSGNLFDTTTSSSIHSGGGKAIFVMNKSGKIYASPTQVLGKFHHSSFLSGKPVAAAGELTVVNGVIKEISRKSGHYQPSVKINSQILTELERRGIDIKSIRETRGF